MVGPATDTIGNSLRGSYVPRCTTGGQRLCRAPLFLPYLSGERSPHNDPQASGCFFNLRHETNCALLGYVVIEGVVPGLADGLKVLSSARINQCSLTGGGARSLVWAQLIADVLAISVITHPSSSSGAQGAARPGWQVVAQKPQCA